MNTNSAYKANAIMPYMARSAAARRALLPTLNKVSRAAMAMAGANFSLTGSTMVGVNSSTAISTRSGSRSQRHIHEVRRKPTNRHPKAARA
ncbi:hypothetical protein D3C79_932080 [compost metagenome]